MGNHGRIPSAFADFLLNEIERQNKSLAEVADASELSYEFIRKVVRGLAFPSEEATRNICHVLHLDENQVVHMLLAEKMKHRFGESNFYAISNKEASLEPIERDWPFLTPEQRETVIGMIQGMAERERNREHQARAQRQSPAAKKKEG